MLELFWKKTRLFRRFKKKIPTSLKQFFSISLWKRAWPFIFTHLNSFHYRMCCAKFAWNWRSASGEEVRIFFKLFTGRQNEMDRWMLDKKQSEKFTWAFQHRWAKNNNQSSYSQIHNTFVHILVGFVRSFLYSQCYQIMPIHDICSNKKWNGYKIQAQLKSISQNY